MKNHIILSKIKTMKYFTFTVKVLNNINIVFHRFDREIHIPKTVVYRDIDFATEILYNNI